MLAGAYDNRNAILVGITIEIATDCGNRLLSLVTVRVYFGCFRRQAGTSLRAVRPIPITAFPPHPPPPVRRERTA